jgi:hypothetical protein
MKDPLSIEPKETLPMSKTMTPDDYWKIVKLETLKRFSSKEGFKIFTEIDGEEEKKPVTFSRLEQLEPKAKREEYSYVSQDAFITHIDMMTKEMNNAWEHEDRVKTLKLAIQVTKMLKDVLTQDYYPAVFVTLTSMLEHFGNLVYRRLKDMAFDAPTGDMFLASQVKEQAKDTAQNWFMKISCIRELQPRLYIELSLLKCYKFLWMDKFQQVLKRMAEQIRGIGNPIMAAYCAMFLTHVGLEASVKSREYIQILVEDISAVVSTLPKEKYKLCIPALEWIFYTLSYDSSKNSLMETLDFLMPHIKKQPDLLRIILETFDSEIVIKNMDNILPIITKLEKPVEYIPLLGMVIKAFIRSPPTRNKYQFLNEVWTPITNAGNTHIKQYLKAAGAFIDLLLTHYSLRDVESLLKDVITKISASKHNIDITSELAFIVNLLIDRHSDIFALLSLENFLGLIEQFPFSKKTDICKRILEMLSKDSNLNSVNNPLLLHGIFVICRVIHDGILLFQHAVEFIDRVQNVLCRVIRKINLGRDLEQHLNLLAEARASFADFEKVTETLVYSSLEIAMKAYKFVKGNHNLKTLAFVKASVSYAHITVPSLESNTLQAKLYLHAAQVALLNGLLGEAESLVKACISMIPVLNEENKLDQAENIIDSLIGLMVYLPDNPASNIGFLTPAFGLVNALSQVNEKYSKMRLRLMTNLLLYIGTQHQDRLPHKLHRGKV